MENKEYKEDKMDKKDKENREDKNVDETLNVFYLAIVLL